MRLALVLSRSGSRADRDSAAPSESGTSTWPTVSSSTPPCTPFAVLPPCAVAARAARGELPKKLAGPLSLLAPSLSSRAFVRGGGHPPLTPPRHGNTLLIIHCAAQGRLHCRGSIRLPWPPTTLAPARSAGCLVERVPVYHCKAQRHLDECAYDGHGHSESCTTHTGSQKAPCHQNDGDRLRYVHHCCVLRHTAPQVSCSQAL